MLKFIRGHQIMKKKNACLLACLSSLKILVNPNLGMALSLFFDHMKCFIDLFHGAVDLPRVSA